MYDIDLPDKARTSLNILRAHIRSLRDSAIPRAVILLGMVLEILEPSSTSWSSSGRGQDLPTVPDCI